MKSGNLRLYTGVWRSWSPKDTLKAGIRWILKLLGKLLSALWDFFKFLLEEALWQIAYFLEALFYAILGLIFLCLWFYVVYHGFLWFCEAAR